MIKETDPFLCKTLSVNLIMRVCEE